jgi:zinc transporter 1
MELALAIRRCLHAYGIHSSTIQPEFCLDPEHDHSGSTDAGDENLDSPHGSAARTSNPVSCVASKAGSVREPDACLLECGDQCGPGKTCCAPAPSSTDSHDGHDHAH